MGPTPNNKRGWRAYIKNTRKALFYTIAISISLGLAVISFVDVYDGTDGPMMTTQTWPAGTFLSNFPEGDRINTYHRNYLMINGQAGTGIWDVSNPTAPKKVQFSDAANNGHRWWKLGGDLFYREYSVPEVQGTGYKYLDLSNMLERKPITSSDILYTVQDGQSNYDNLETFPHTIDGNRVFDMRTGEQLDDIPASVSLPDVVVRIGNYVFYAPQTGNISVFDFGDPSNIKFLGSFGGDIPHEQYSTGFQLWRNHLVFMSGNEGPDALVGFDISDPTDVKLGFSLHSDQATLGRYMIFQDEFGFSGRFDRGVKFNFETMEIEQEFFPPSSDETLQFIDNQWMPIGHILIASGDDKTSIFAHQDGLDTNPPSVGHHFPISGAINQPISSTIGFVINETLNDLTLNDKTIQVSPLGGTPIEGDVTTTSYQVINYAPKEKLLPNTTYEVKLVEGGIKDAVGNGMEEYVFYFTTGGDTSNQSPEISKIDIDNPSPVEIGSTINFSANASDPDGNDLTYRWDFGDGSPKTEWIGESISHTYSESGNYLVQVQVSDNNGGFVVGSQSIVVVDARYNILPTQSGPITVDIDNRVVWSVNPDNNSVTLINSDDLSIVKEIQVGKDPVNLALDTQGKAWITCRDSDEIYILRKDGLLETIISLDKGSQPYGIVFTPNGSRGFISTFGSGKVLEFSTATNSIVKELAVGEKPRAMAIDGEGNTLLVTRFISPNPEGQIWKIDLNTFTLDTTIGLPLDDFTPDNGNQGRGLPNYVSGITIHPNNKLAWSVAKKDNVVRGLSRDGKPLSFDNIVRTAISSIDLTVDKENLNKRLDIDNHGQPSSALYTPTGNYLFVTMQGNNRIVVIDPKTGLELLKKDVGKAPQGLTIDPINNRVFVKNFMDRSITVFDADNMIKNGSSTLEELTTIVTVDNELLSLTELKGKQIFYDAADIRMGTDGYVSCATCHIDGTEDGRVWDFTDRGEGLRNTISLVGRAGTAHGRVHWSANFDEIQDFENDIRSHFKGQGFMNDQDFNDGTTALTIGDPKIGKSVDLDALTAYIESLNSFSPSPYRNNDGSLTADGVVGKALFEDLKCYQCHSGNNFTDSNFGKLHDVGTITSTTGNRLDNQLLGIDVPTLKDVWATAPYLHNGIAKTLEEVFTIYNNNDAHGATSSLSANQIKQLEAYIKQIDGSELGTVSERQIQMASPIDGALIDRAESQVLSVDTNIDDITKVQYYVDNEMTEEVLSAPFESSWTPVLWKNYTINAKVFYNNGNTASITPEITVQFKNVIKVMFVVGDKNALTLEDQRIKSRLEQQFGFKITLFSDEEATSPQSANPFDMALISSTVDPRELGNDLEGARVPLMTWNPFMYNKLRMVTGELNTGFGITEQGFSSITITSPEHPMAVDSGMETSIYSISQSLPFGNPTDEAVIIAKAGTKPILFGYEASIDIPSRRVAFPLRDQFMHLLTDQGLSMFDAAVLWTLHGGDADTPIGSLPDVFFKSPVEGELVNTPLKIDFNTEGWDLPSQQYKLRFKIDGQDRGLITSEGEFTDGTALTEGPHELSLQMERSDNSVTDLGETITVIVTNDPLPQDPTAIIQSPSDGGLVGPDFEIEFSTYKWDINPGGQHIKYFIDGIEQGSMFQITPIPISGLSEGVHTIVLSLATENGEITGDSAEITITVDERFNNLPDTDFSLEYRDNSSGVSTPELKPVFQIVSESSESHELSDFEIRYWYTPEHAEAMNFNIDYSAVVGTVGTFKTNLEYNYLEIGFSSSSGNLNPNSKSGQIQTRLHHSGFQTHNQSNDYSYDAGKTALKPHVLTTLYYKGELVWGLEPDGSEVTNRKPNAIIDSSITSGVSPLSVSFDASASSDPDGDVLSYSWDFGNGDIATGILNDFIFTTPGDYEVLLTVDDGNGGSDTTSVIITVIDQTPVLTSNFTATPVSGDVPLVVDFNSSSSIYPDGSAITYIWDFGDGNTSDLANPSHTYISSGSYATTLTISDGVNSDISDPVTISVLEGNVAPQANFDMSVTSGVAPLIVSFDASASFDANGDDLEYLWDFGDGTTGDSVNSTHTYNLAGEYIISLTVSDGVLSDNQTTTLIVNESTGTTGCTFGAPMSTPLPTLSNFSYDYVYVLGEGGPDLSNMANFTINWDLQNNGLWQFSMNTNNGNPAWWIDLTASIVSQTFNQEQPTVTFSGIGISNFDGAYDVVMDGDNFALVSKSGAFTIYFSNQNNAPSCDNKLSEPLKDNFIIVKAFPNPVIDYLTIQSDQNLKGTLIRIVDINGKTLSSVGIHRNIKTTELDMSMFQSGIYFIQIQKNQKTVIKQITK
ncbi:Por secretion system C-terminal sorting domain-containing protein [Aquimarina amphilecti]|uniref:Por secretion system C-terminal sorting domain-containing protein n=1 Tax=Aquimarina amphilecti TaxID=1038014 RepID=A0A1H7T878_AQUAM|nr:PKD domain-containing protein [Aquimarina amphilecti]SEL80476.1 Por secretion system C-terminal sorting domain-containing protein [Aquimarina amphilecti]